jgi:hypothetical protein
LLLLPKTVTLSEIACVPENIVRVAFALPFGLRATLEGVIDQVLHWGEGQRAGGDVDRDTIPLNPSRLLSVIVEVPEEPAMRVRLDGVAIIAKLGETTLIGSQALVAPGLPASPL